MISALFLSNSSIRLLSSCLSSIFLASILVKESLSLNPFLDNISYAERNHVTFLTRGQAKFCQEKIKLINKFQFVFVTRSPDLPLDYCFVKYSPASVLSSINHKI